MAGFFLGNNGSGGYLAVAAPFNGTVDAFVHAGTMYVVFPENGPHGMTVLRVTDPDGNDLYKRELFGDGVTIIFGVRARPSAKSGTWKVVVTTFPPGQFGTGDRAVWFEDLGVPVQPGDL